MKRKNKIYRRLLDRSVASMLSAIEIYNKPDFQYREESFAILAVNSWELLLKAYILRQNHWKKESIYKTTPKTNKNGTEHKKKRTIEKNLSGNPKLISISEAIDIMSNSGNLPKNLCDNIKALIELRNNFIHFISITAMSKQIQEIGFACIKNYMSIVKLWDMEIDLSSYNFYLMPLAYVGEKTIADPILTEEAEKYLGLIKSMLNEKEQNDDFDIAISIDVNFKKGNSFESIGVSYSPEGVPISLSEEAIIQKFPWTYKEVCEHCKNRYSDYKQNEKFNSLMRVIKDNDKLCYRRKHCPNNPKSSETRLYSSNIFNELDKSYTKK